MPSGMNIPAPCVWFCGFSGAGKTTIANALSRQLAARACPSLVLDGDVLRSGLCNDLGFSQADRRENLRRTRELAKIIAYSGVVPIVACISPFEADRSLSRCLFPQGGFVLVFVDTPLSECMLRDPKGLYRKVGNGQLQEFTGVDSPFEAPALPEVHVRNQSTEAAVRSITQTPAMENWMAMLHQR